MAEFETKAINDLATGWDELVERLAQSSYDNGLIVGYSSGFKRGFRRAIVCAIIGVGLGHYISYRLENWYDNKKAETGEPVTLFTFGGEKMDVEA